MARRKRPNYYRPRKNPAVNRKARAQRLRRALEKEAKMKLCKLQQITNESFQDSSQKMSNIDSVPTTSREITNSHEESKRTYDLSQNVTITDSFSVIQTEILDPSEKNPGLIFQEDPQCATTVPTTNREILNSHEEKESKRTSDFLQNPIIIDTFSVIKTDIIDQSEKYPGLIFQHDSQCATATNSMPVVDFSRTSQIVPNIKVEPERDAPFLYQTNTESVSTEKENIGFNHAVHYNKVIKKIVPTIKPKSVCGCFEKIAKIKHLCESYLKLVQQDNTNKLCLCNADSHSIPENMKPVEKLMKKLSSLLNSYS